jgi:hypothetical protein
MEEKPRNPSPKFHVQDWTVPSGSKLAEPSKLTVCPATGLLGVKVNLAVGGMSGGASTNSVSDVKCETEPLVPDTVTVHDCCGVVLNVDIVRDEDAVPEAVRAMLLGLRNGLGSPFDPLGKTVTVSMTVPANPLVLVSVTLVPALVPAGTAKDDANVESVKSGCGGWVTTRIMDML